MAKGSPPFASQTRNTVTIPLVEPDNTLVQGVNLSMSGYTQFTRSIDDVIRFVSITSTDGAVNLDVNVIGDRCDSSVGEDEVAFGLMQTSRGP